MRRKRAGVSIVEMLVVVALFAITGAAAVPVLTSYVKRQNIASQARQLVFVLRTAQTNSLIQEGQKRWMVEFEPNGLSYFMQPEGNEDALLRDRYTLLESAKLRLCLGGPVAGNSIVFPNTTTAENRFYFVELYSVDGEEESLFIFVNTKGAISLSTTHTQSCQNSPWFDPLPLSSPPGFAEGPSLSPPFVTSSSSSSSTSYADLSSDSSSSSSYSPAEPSGTRLYITGEETEETNEVGILNLALDGEALLLFRASIAGDSGNEDRDVFLRDITFYPLTEEESLSYVRTYELFIDDTLVATQEYEEGDDVIRFTDVASFGLPAEEEKILEVRGSDIVFPLKIADLQIQIGAEDGGGPSYVRASHTSHAGVMLQGISTNGSCQNGSFGCDIFVTTATTPVWRFDSEVYCFLPGTPVTLADGTTKAIEDLREGEDVLAYDETTGLQTAAKIVRTLARTTDSYFIIDTGSRVLSVTGEHPFYVGSSWKEARYLRPGDALLRSDGTTEHVVYIEEKQEDATVYNLTVDGVHTFYADDILVHNKSCMCNGVISDCSSCGDDDDDDDDDDGDDDGDNGTTGDSDGTSADTTGGGTSGGGTSGGGTSGGGGSGGWGSGGGGWGSGEGEGWGS